MAAFGGGFGVGLAVAPPRDPLGDARGRAMVLCGAAISLRRRCDVGESGFSPLRIRVDPPSMAPATSCTDLDIAVSCRGGSSDELEDCAKRLGEILKLIHVAIAQCHPIVLNELLVGSPCPLARCAFCDDLVRVGSVRLVAMAPNQPLVLGRALFKQEHHEQSDEFQELHRLLQSPAFQLSPPVGLSLRLSVGFAISGWWRSELTMDELLEDTKQFVHDARGGCRIGEIAEILIYQCFTTQIISELVPILRVFMNSGLPIALCEPGPDSLWREKQDDWSWLLGNDTGMTECYSRTRLTGLALRKSNPTTHDEWDRLCRMLQAPNLREYLRVLTLRADLPTRHEIANAEVAKRVGIAIFDSSVPLHLRYLSLPSSFTDLDLSAMVEGRAEALERQKSSPSFDHVVVDASDVTDIGFDHIVTLVGATVKHLEINGQSQSISPKLLRRILSACPQLEQLNVRLSNQDWELFGDVSGDSIVAPLKELVLDAGVTLIQSFYQQYAPRTPVPTASMTNLLRFIGRNLRRLQVKLPTSDTADETMAEALVEHCPKLQSLELSNVGEGFVSTLVTALEDPRRPLTLHTLGLPLHCVSPASRLTTALLEEGSRTRRSLRNLSVCTTDQANREIITQSFQSLGNIYNKNRMLTTLTIDTRGFVLTPEERTVMSLHLQLHVPTTDNRRSDVVVRPPMPVQLALLSAFRRLLEVDSGIPAEIVERVWGYHCRRPTRRLVLLSDV